MTLVFGIAASWFFSHSIFSFITSSLVESNIRFIITSPLEGFFISLKISFYSGLILTSPLWLYFLLSYLIPALTSRERRLIPALLTSLYGVGSLTLYFAIQSLVPMANTFLANYNSLFAENYWSLSEYLQFVITLSFSLLLGSQILGALFLLIHFGYILYEHLVQHRKKAYLVAFILGALLTPPDVPSQLAMAIVLILFYELFALYSRLRARF